MKVTPTLLFFAAIILLAFTKPAKYKSALPFYINIKAPYKLSAQEQRESYDYMEYTAGQDLIQVKQYPAVTKEKAKKIIEDRKFFLLALFDDQPAAYPGVLSNSIGCPAQLMPVVYEDSTALSLSFKLLATVNRVYGNCNPADNFYCSIYSVFYCPRKHQLFEVKIFTPAGAPSFNYNGFVPNITCKCN